MPKLIGSIFGFWMPISAISLAMFQSQFKFDGTITVGNILVALGFLGGGLVAILAAPRQIETLNKWSVSHEQWAKQQSETFSEAIRQLSQILVELRAQRGEDTRRLDSIEERFNNHVENGGHNNKHNRARGGSMGGSD